MAGLVEKLEGLTIKAEGESFAFTGADGDRRGRCVELLGHRFGFTANRGEQPLSDVIAIAANSQLKGAAIANDIVLRAAMYRAHGHHCWSQGTDLAADDRLQRDDEEGNPNLWRSQLDGAR